MRGLRRSTIVPAGGVSQVSVAMKMENAHWISASRQPRNRCMGLTNNVQPYCRLAINAMQTTPRQSWTQRPRSFGETDALLDSDVLPDCRFGIVVSFEL